ncbi:MAG: M48 family metalloprotease [bacterium]|nr:M48 family metalloprotease [bacterium]
MLNSSPATSRGWIRRTSLLLLLTSASVACGTISVKEEKQLGHQAQRQVAKQFTLMREPVTVSYVRKLGAELSSAARPSPFNFRFYVVESEDLNAFAIPGGAIYVNTGLIQAVDNAAELAGVIAHEIGHVTARHVAQNVRRQRNTGFIAQVASMAIAILTGNYYMANAGDMASRVAAQAYLSTYSREFEREADLLAVETMRGAGYDPNALITMFETLKEEAGGGLKPPQLLASHPATTDRMENARSEIAALPDLGRARKDDGGRLAIIQKRLELIVGTDAGIDVEEGDEAEE